MMKERSGPPRAWVLVSDGGTGQGRSALAAVRALGAGGYRVAVTVTGPHNLAAASRWCTRAVVAPPATSAGFLAAIRQEQAAIAPIQTLPASDAALRLLDPATTDLVDKAALAPLARASGFRVPDQEVFPSGDELVADAGRLPYPVVIKPAADALPAWRADEPADVAAAGAVRGRLVVQRFVVEALRAVAGVMWDGGLHAVVHQRYLRTWPVECGTAAAAETVECDTSLEERVVDLLSRHQGVFQVQLAGDQLLDVNPRVYGSLPLAVAAGANLPALQCRLAAGHTSAQIRGRPGVRYRWIEGDARHVLHRLREREISVREATAMVRPRPGTAHSVISGRDPMPALARLRHVAQVRR